jgi:hypothetical protein
VVRAPRTGRRHRLAARRVRPARFPRHDEFVRRTLRGVSRREANKVHARDSLSTCSGRAGPSRAHVNQLAEQRWEAHAVVRETTPARFIRWSANQRGTIWHLVGASRPNPRHRSRRRRDLRTRRRGLRLPVPRHERVAIRPRRLGRCRRRDRAGCHGRDAGASSHGCASDRLIRSVSIPRFSVRCG